MKLFLIILLMILLLVCLLLVSSIRLKLSFNQQGLVVVSYLFFQYRIPLYGGTKKEKKKQKASKNKTNKKEKSGYVKRLFKQKGILDGTVELLTVIQRLMEKIAHLLSRAQVEELKLRMVVAEEDPAETAITYGAVCALVYPAVGVINGLMPVEKQNVDLQAAYEKDQLEFAFSAIIKVRFHNVISAAYTFFKDYIKSRIH